VVLAPVRAEPGRSSLHASIEGLSCELDVLEEYDSGGDNSELETSDPLPSRTSEKVLSAWTATALARRDRGRGVGAAELLQDAGDDDVGDCGDDALIAAILVETWDDDLGDGAVGPPGPKTAEGLAAGFEPETPPSRALANGSDDAEPEDNADPGLAALPSVCPRHEGRLESPTVESLRSS
jgi:hypothetical protein